MSQDPENDALIALMGKERTALLRDSVRTADDVLKLAEAVRTIEGGRSDDEERRKERLTEFAKYFGITLAAIFSGFLLISNGLLGVTINAIKASTESAGILEGALNKAEDAAAAATEALDKANAALGAAEDKLAGLEADVTATQAELDRISAERDGLAIERDRLASEVTLERLPGVLLENCERDFARTLFDTLSEQYRMPPWNGNASSEGSVVVFFLNDGQIRYTAYMREADSSISFRRSDSGQWRFEGDELRVDFMAKEARSLSLSFVTKDVLAKIAKREPGTSGRVTICNTGGKVCFDLVECPKS